MMSIKRILHPTDLCDSSHPVFEVACALARDYGARLIVLHVTSVPDLAYTGYGAPAAPLERKEYLEDKRQALEHLQPPDSKIAVERCVVEGDPSEEIVRFASQREIDLIVLGTRDRGGLLERLLGSVAEEVLRKATCPVLTLRVPSNA